MEGVFDSLIHTCRTCYVDVVLFSAWTRCSELWSFSFLARIVYHDVICSGSLVRVDGWNHVDTEKGSLCL